MAVERAPGGTSLIDVLEVEARVVIASIDTYLKYAEAVGITSTVARPALGPGEGAGVATGAAAPAGVTRP
jgi:hypothetical protein